MKLSQFTTMRGYQQAETFRNSNMVDHFLNGDQGDALRADLKMKRIQFDTSQDLSDRLENVCTMLDCSKRVFLEMAVSEAIDAAEDQFNEAFFQAYGQDIASAHEALQHEQAKA